MMDALRLVVFLGVLLWMIPLAWPDGSEAVGEPVSMSQALFYVFGVWILLIALAFLLARSLKDPKSDSASAPKERL